MNKMFCLLAVAAIALCSIALTVSCRGEEDQPCLPPVEENPFYSLFEGGNEPDTVSFEGTVRAASLIPDPEKNDYPNCLYALFVELDSVLSSTPLSKRVAYEVIVNVPVMKDKTILEQNIFLPGDRISCICADYDAMPQAIREIQLSDDIQSFEHQQYYALSICKVQDFRTTGNRDFAKREITVLPVQSWPKDENAARMRRDRIQKEIARIEEELKMHGGTFSAWKEEYKTIAAKYKDLRDKKYRGWIGDSYFAADGEETTYNTREYIDGILPYKKYLEENNIDLILVRIPSKGDFAARVLASDDFQENPEWVEHYFECLKNDIEVIDPMPEMWKHRFDFPLFYFYTLEAEQHPFEGQAVITAQMLSGVLKRYRYSRTDQPITLEDADFKADDDDSRFFWPKGNKKFDPAKTIGFKQTNQNGRPIGNLAVNTGSPFLFLSNSFFWYPQRELGASVPGYTAFFLQHVPDWLYQDGINNQMIRNLVCSPEILQKRKAVIMVKMPAMCREGFPDLPRYLSEHVEVITMEKSLGFLDSGIKIHDNGSFTFKKEKDGLVHFTRNMLKFRAENQFGIELAIPPCEGKTTCMLRMNFKKNSSISLNVLDAADGSVIDSTRLPSGKNARFDFFIPVTESERTIRIQFIPSNPKRDFFVRNLELWYF